MGRINVNDVEKYDGQDDSKSFEWLKLADDGDVARVQFLYDNYNELETFAAHRVKLVSKEGKEYEKWVDCKRNYDDPVDMCPFCRDGLAVKSVTIISMYDHKDGKVKIWERGKTFRKKIENLFNRYPKLSDMVFEIERNGAKGDKKTTYELYPMPDVDPVDVSNVERPDFLGTVILDKSVEDMEFYQQNKYFPYKDDNEQDSEQTTSRRAGGATQSRGGVQRRPRA